MRSQASLANAMITVMAPGGFKTVELNAVGWAALLAAGSAAGAIAGIVFARSALFAAVLIGALAACGSARVADEIRDRRRWSYVPVANAETASAALRSAGIRVLGTAHDIVRGRAVAYLAVPERDSERAIAMVGLPHESRRGERRWYGALRAAASLPRPRG